jgi:hypothetical protein
MEGMPMSQRSIAGLLRLTYAVMALLLWPSFALSESEVLPSWNDGPTRQAIVTFVTRATSQASPDFVPPAERIAVFDNDGTLWTEQPLYNQLAFAADRVEELAAQHPEWASTQPFKAALDDDRNTLLAGGERGLAELVKATHTGISTEEFSGIVSGWLSTSRHPRYDRPYTELVYQPMLELLSYLRRNGFKVYIVANGSAEFVRAWSEVVYSVPPQQVIGTTFLTRYQIGPDGKPVLLREAEYELVDDGPGKPVAINKFIGRRPVFAFGNSDGDLQMLQWTASGSSSPRFIGLLHHTDAEREWAYDRESPVGKLDKALDAARDQGWTVVDMKADWKKVFPFSWEGRERPK